MKILSGNRQNTEDALQCSACGGQYLHHDRVEIFNRHREDAENGLHVTVDGQRFSGDDDQRGNPSGRRDGLSIRLTCEACPAISFLCLRQIKGWTYLSLDVEDDEAPAVELKQKAKPAIPATVPALSR